MAKSYCSLHITTYRGLVGIGAHLDRHHVPRNADSTRTQLNEELSERARGPLTADVEQRIEEGYTQRRKIRKDARKALGIVLSGTHAQMKAIEKDEERFAAWKAANYRFACAHFGKENIVRFTVHRDEKTPHIHCVVVPITADGRLSAKDYVGGKEYGDGKARLRAYQEAYGQAMAPFGLSRGLPAEYTQAKHMSTHTYYRTVQELEQRAVQQCAAVQARNVLKLKDVRADLEQALVQAHRTAYDEQVRAGRLLRDYEGRLRRELQQVQRQVNFIQHVASMGYVLNTTESSAACAVMEKGGEKLLIDVPPEGAWTYRAANDKADQGTIVEFMLRRGHDVGHIRKLSSTHLDKGVLEAHARATDRAQQQEKNRNRHNALSL